MSERAKVLEEIEQELRRCGRSLKSATLVVASKYLSIEQILELYQEGQRDFGENKVQDALKKKRELPSDIRWHFIGHLQKNKVNKIIGEFELIHSVDSFELAEKISQKAKGVERLLLQVNTSLEASKEGMTKEAFLKALPKIEALENIRVEGLMTLAPLTEDQKVIRRAFKALAEIKKELQKDDWSLSMGMSQDFKIALQEGAHYVRIGRRLLRR